METLNNPKPILGNVDALPAIKDRIDKTTNEFNNYLEYLKYEQFIEIPNEKEEDAIKRAESIVDRLDEIVRRREIVMTNGKETIELIDEVKSKIEKVVKSCENDRIHIEKANDELIDKLIKLEERKRTRDIAPLQQQIDDINNKSNKRIQELKGDLKNPEEYNRKKEQEDSKRGEEEIRKQEQIKKRTNNTINLNEIKQIEKWTRMKIGSVIFDSNVDNWKVSASVFDQRIINKSNLVFIIEDEDGNKFGGYVSAKIDKIYPRDTNSWITDPKSFVFSLKSNGRLNGMLKFDIKKSKPQHAFLLDNKSYDDLLQIGVGDIRIHKENNKNNSYCYQTSFNYNGIENALCGKTEDFTPKRITAIQLI